ncbi:ketoacyl-ACP synthase III [Nocardioides sp. GY 10113]|uniref:beta-ketoacyl-ACP synthase III n=1 Tax=Nocardioides sp. GY 10113 TaxID=2569761 RepID=UPI0010A86B69|nr:beta-ketoacyl-ACP synthase III [Nocardioides sp. GY 10113]TIC81518.1 ketoacyl-ACP synthase III [Nocardioides sp. GY 10113]
MSKISQRPGAAATAMLGLGIYRPERVVTNAEICEVLDSSDEWIQSRTGIQRRRFAREDETVIDMGVAAAEDALKAAGITADQIGAVIVASTTQGQHTPHAAPMLADRLGSRAASFDVSAGCAGFCHALSVASDLVRGGSAEYALVVGVEKVSDFLDPTDRSTAMIFADGAGAVVVGPADEPGIGPVAWGSDGSQSQVIRQEPRCRQVEHDQQPVIAMEGQAVFRWAPFKMADVAREAVASAGLELADLDAFVPHQANMRITDTLVRNLKLPEGIPVARDIADTGNTSAASVPLAIERMVRDGEAKPGDTALLIAFGAGLSYAGQVVTLPPVAGL